MRKVLLIALPLLLAVFALLSTDQAKPAALKGKITEFSLSDMPYDDGAGMILKWKPLDKSHRVIEYHIYRGVSPDSLFMLAKIEVDPKMGVMSPELFYYDRGDQPLIEFETAPTHLKKEKQQPANSPLYRYFPLDAKLLGTLTGRYNIVAGMKSDKFYYCSKPVKIGEDTFAGLKLKHFEYVFATPIPGQTYYYTVVPVNEKGQYLPPADIQKIVPEDNPPDNNAQYYSTWMKDTGVINYEWTPPVDSPDIAVWEGWLIPKSLAPGEGNPLPANWQANAIQLFQIDNIYTQGFQYHSVDTKAENIKLPDNPDNWTTVLAYSDYSGLSAACTARQHRTIVSKELPHDYGFTIEDKPNDKGDNLVVSIGKPIAYLNNATFTDAKKRKLRISYEISENQHYRIKNIDFVLKDKQGKLIEKATENFMDKVVLLRLPHNYIGLTDFNLEITLHSRGEHSADSEVTSEHVVFDPNNKLFRGETIYYRNEPVSKLYYDVLGKTNLDPDFLFGNRNNGITRAYDFSIPYEDIIYRPIQSYDAKSKCLTLDPKILVAVDQKSGNQLAVPLFKAAFEADLKKQQSEIASLKAKLAKFPAGQAPDSLTAALNAAESSYNYVLTNPTVKQANQAKNPKQWLKTMVQVRHQNARSYSYRLLKTDGRGALVISRTYADKHNNSTFIPKSEWFDTTKYATLIAMILLTGILVYTIFIFRRKEAYIRPIAGLQEIDNALGRATEMGRPIMFVPGWGTLGEVDMIASMLILAQIAKKAAEFDIRLISPHCDYMVLPLAQELVQTSYGEVGRPDAYNQNDIFYVSSEQFPFCAGVNGITIRERVATVFYMGFFNAEALLLTETGNQAGAIQIAGTDSTTQIPFFITTCDYTLIGEEFYAASAYMSHNYELICMLKTQDYFKLILVVLILVGTVLSSLHFNSLINFLPVE